MTDRKPYREYIRRLNASIERGDSTEHTHRPALKDLLESVGGGGIAATNEPRRIACGAPDLAVNQAGGNLPALGYVEAKDVGTDLAAIERDSIRANPATPNGRQLRRYRESLPNLALTDYVEFRWYADGDHVSTARLSEQDGGGGGNLALSESGVRAVSDLLAGFFSRAPSPVASADELAERMAMSTRMIRDIVKGGFEAGQTSADLSDLCAAMRDALVPDLSAESFADMFAQTLAYGLFAAKVNHQAGQSGQSESFARGNAAALIPRTNPFVRQIFRVIAGPDLDDEPFVGFVDDLTQLLNGADMESVLRGFGRRAARQDPIMHFYERFLAAYDPATRERRGVYYTPEPVVGYIIRSVDNILRDDFGCAEGLADRSMTRYSVETETEDGIAARESESHRVLVLDPACGSGAFLYGVIDHIREHYRAGGNAGMWRGYVKEHLAKRLFGFELIMAAYALAHLKLGMQFAAHDMPEERRAAWACEFEGDERLGVYLTNTLEAAERKTETLWGPMRAITQEADAASEIKRDLPIMVVLGNPPYSGHSANQSRRNGKLTWIGELIEDYKTADGKPLGERNPKWLQDDYVKFIRFGQHRIERTGSGVLAFITNHAYLDNPTFRGMRQRLMETFTDIYILDLHGNAKRRERAPGGGADRNVFDIQQGVAISIFVKKPGAEKPNDETGATVHHADLWGTRESKYETLSASDVSRTEWTRLKPKSPNYLFIPWDDELEDEYGRFPKITEIMPVNSVGVVTGRDKTAIQWTRDEMADVARAILSRENRELDESLITPIMYRPFDTRHTYYDDALITRRRQEVMRHMLMGDNLGLIACRQQSEAGVEWNRCGVTRSIIEACAISNKTREINSLFPLYKYPSLAESEKGIKDGQQREQEVYARDYREANLSPEFIDGLKSQLGLRFAGDGAGDLLATFGPEDVFHYTYAVFHSPAYRERYGQFLRADFPRVPPPGCADAFRDLAKLGACLARVHLLEESPASDGAASVSYPVVGDNVVERGHPKYYAPGEKPPGEKSPLERGRVYISRDDRKTGKRGQYFEGVEPEVWAFRMGGYQPLEKWLRDRRGRALTFADLAHYQAITAALRETMRLTDAVDREVARYGVVPSG